MNGLVCPECNKEVIPSIRMIPRFGIFRQPITEHYCPLCGFHIKNGGGQYSFIGKQAGNGIKALIGIAIGWFVFTSILKIIPGESIGKVDPVDTSFIMTLFSLVFTTIVILLVLFFRVPQFRSWISNKLKKK